MAVNSASPPRPYPRLGRPQVVAAREAQRAGLAHHLDLDAARLAPGLRPGDVLESVGGYVGDLEGAKAEAIATAEHFGTCEGLAA